MGVEIDPADTPDRAVRIVGDHPDAEVPAGTVSLTGILQYDAAGDGRYILKLRDENDCTH